MSYVIHNFSQGNQIKPAQSEPVPYYKDPNILVRLLRVVAPMQPLPPLPVPYFKEQMN